MNPFKSYIFCRGPNKIVAILLAGIQSAPPFGCHNKIYALYLSFLIISMIWFEVCEFYPYIVCNTKQTWAIIFPTLDCLRPHGPPVLSAHWSRPVAQAYSAGEGLWQKPTSTLPARPPSSSSSASPFAPSFHSSRSSATLPSSLPAAPALWRCSSAPETSAWADYWSIPVLPASPSRLPRSCCVLHLDPPPHQLSSASTSPHFWLGPPPASSRNPGSFRAGGPCGRDPSCNPRVASLLLLRWLLGLLRHDLWTAAVGEQRGSWSLSNKQIHMGRIFPEIV